MELVHPTATVPPGDRLLGPRDIERRDQEDTAYIGLVIFLGSWSVMFAALFFAYALYRVGANAGWPPPEFKLVPLWLPLMNTGVIVASSVALERARRRLAAGDAAGYRGLLMQCGVLAVTFVSLQMWLWSGLWESGITLRGAHYGAYLYLLTGFHALHVVVGLGLLGWLRVQASGPPHPGWSSRARLVGIYWHFVGVAWLLLFLLLFVV